MAKRSKRVKRSKGVKVKVRRKAATAAAVAAPRPFLFVSGKRSKGFSMAKRKSGKRRGGGVGGSSGGGSFFGKPVLMTVAGAAAASAFGPRIRAMLPASMQTGGGLAASALIGLGGGFLLAKVLGREAGAGFAAGFVAPDIGALFSGATAGRPSSGMRGLPGESAGVSYLPEMAGYSEDDLSGVDDEDLSGFESDALEV